YDTTPLALVPPYTPESPLTNPLVCLLKPNFSSKTNVCQYDVGKLSAVETKLKIMKNTTLCVFSPWKDAGKYGKKSPLMSQNFTNKSKWMIANTCKIP